MQWLATILFQQRLRCPIWVEEDEATMEMQIWPQRPSIPAAHAHNKYNLLVDFEINLSSPMVTPGRNLNHIINIDGEELTEGSKMKRDLDKTRKAKALHVPLPSPMTMTMMKVTTMSISPQVRG
jgi:hypothetical protein